MALVTCWVSHACMGAHVVYFVVVVGRTHLQIGPVHRKNQCGPPFGKKCMSLYGPMEISCVSSRLGPHIMCCIFMNRPIGKCYNVPTMKSCWPMISAPSRKSTAKQKARIGLQMHGHLSMSLNWPTAGPSRMHRAAGRDSCMGLQRECCREI